MFNKKNKHCSECDVSIGVDLPVTQCYQCAYAEMYAESDISREMTKLIEAELNSISECKKFITNFFRT